MQYASSVLPIRHMHSGVNKNILPGEVTKAVKECGYSAVIRHVATSIDSLQQLENLLRQSDIALADPEETNWATFTATAIRKLAPEWSNKDMHFYKSYCKWAFTPIPPVNGLIAFKDVTLEFSGKTIKQVKKNHIS